MLRQLEGAGGAEEAAAAERKAMKQKQAKNKKKKSAAPAPHKLPPGSIPTSAPKYTRNATTMVLFDGNYNKLFDCWSRLFLDAAGASNPSLLAVPLDDLARIHVDLWGQRHPDILVHRDVEVPRADSKGRPIGEAPAETRLWAAGRANYGLKASRSSWPSSVYSKEFWVAMKKSLDAGVDVLHADLDAFIVDDPWRLFTLEHVADADLVGSTDNQPLDVSREWGFTLNPGFMLFRATPHVRELVDYMIDKWENDRFWEVGNWGAERHDCNEQYLMNRYLSKLGCEWEDRRHEKVRTARYLGHCGGLRVAVLPEERVSRKRTCGDVAACRADYKTVVHSKKSPVLRDLCNATNGELFQRVFG